MSVLNELHEGHYGDSDLILKKNPYLVINEMISYIRLDEAVIT
jgi:hypothetical protein